MIGTGSRREFGDDLELDVNPDAISILATRRDNQWFALKNANFQTRDQKGEDVGYGSVDTSDDDVDGDEDYDFARVDA
jgi:hypothetical protein